MIAWLAARGTRSRLPFTGVGADRRWLRVAPCEFAAHLPLAGPVLTLATTAAAAPASRLLVARAELAPLQAMSWLVVGSRVDVDGPHEWIECRDRDGRLGLQCHLLPDTDYLGWEALTGMGGAGCTHNLPPLRDPPPAFLGVLDFRWRRQAGLGWLDAHDVATVSRWGADVVRAVARATGLPVTLPTAPARR